MAILLLLSGGATASAFSPSDRGPPERWFRRDAPIVIRIGTQGASVAPEVLVTSIQAAFDTWAGAACPGMPRFTAVRDDSVTSLGAPGSTSLAPDPLVVTYASHAQGGERLSSLVSGDRAVTLVDAAPGSGEIVDGDIVLNDVDFELSDDETCGPNVTPLRGLILHEVGLLLGLEPSDVPGAVMAAYGDCQVRPLSLSAADMAAVCSLYADAPEHGDAPVNQADPGCAAGAPLSAYALAMLVLSRLHRRRSAA